MPEQEEVFLADQETEGPDQCCLTQQGALCFRPQRDKNICDFLRNDFYCKTLGRRPNASSVSSS